MKAYAWLLTCTLLAPAATARAQEPHPTATPGTPSGSATALPPAAQTPNAQEAPPSAPPTAAKPSELDFNLFGDEKHKSPLDEAKEKQRIERLERAVRLRRKLLLAHQILGFATLAVMATTDIIGQLNYDDKYLRNGTDSGQFATAHESLGIITTALFGATGIVALAAPNPYPKPIKFDAAFVHKASMALATAGMLLQIILGPLTAVSDGRLYQRDIALTHVISGWATFGFMGAGTLAYVF